MGIINRPQKGFTLIEMLVSVSVFAILAVISTQILALSLRGVTKSQNLAETRENIDHAATTMERLLKSSRSCTLGSGFPFVYQDQFGVDVTLDCLTDAEGYGYIASESARLTSTRVDIECDTSATEYSDISCARPDPGRPFIVDIKIVGSDTSHAGTIEGSEYTSTTKVLIRNYSSD